MSCALDNKNTKYDVLIAQLQREVKEITENCAKEHLLYEKKLNEMCVYVKENLSNTIRELLDTMLSSGELDDIITETIANAINGLEDKTADFITVKAFGAVGDGLHDDTNALQDAIDYALLHNKIVYVPAGEYKTTRALRLYQSQKLIGQGAAHTTIKRTGKIREAGATFSAAIILDRTNNFKFDYTSGQNISNISFNCESADYGIYCPTAAPYIEIDNVNVNKAITAISLNGGWLATLSNINIWKCVTGIQYRTSGTSTTLKNIYVMEAEQYAYDFEGLSYSHWQNVCADWCKGVAYRLVFCTITIDGLGCESNDARIFMYVNNSNISVTGAHVFALERTDGEYIHGNGSELLIAHSNIGSNGTSKAKFCTAGTAFNLHLKNCKLNSIDAESTSGATYNIVKMESGRSDFMLTQYEKLSFIGAYNNESMKGEQLGYDIPMFAAYGNIMGHPYYGKGLDGNREWYSVKNCGDLFINQAPQNNGVAFYQQTTDTDKHYSEGVITAIGGNVLSVSHMGIGFVAEKRGTLITTAGSLYNEDGKATKITDVSYDNKTITVKDGSVFKVGDHFHYRIDVTYMRDVKYAPVQQISTGNSAARPKERPIGFMYFDMTIMRPIWWTGSKWVDSDGATR